MAESFVARLRRLAREDPHAPAVTFGDLTLDRATLLERADRLAGHLVAGGVRLGDYVSIVLPNGLEQVVSVVAAYLVGAITQPLSAKLAAAELSQILDITAPRAVIGELPFAREGLVVPASLVVPAGLDVPASLVVPASLEAPIGDPGQPDHLVSPSWKAPTSGGSTGRPKVIVANQPAVWDEVSAFAAVLGVDGQTSLITAPMSHNGPFISAALTLVSGGHVIVMGRFDAEEALRLIERHRVTWVYAVPTIMGRILKLEESVRLGFDLGSLRTLMHMAAPCPPAVKLAFIEWLGGERILELYAGTEAQAATVINGADWLTHRGSVGRALLGEFEVRDDAGDRVPPGVIGRIWLRRGADGVPSYFYLGATTTVLEGGWESLGDLGYLDVEGYLYLVDRDTDMILVGGSNVYPAEVEAALLEHPLVADACVIGLPHADLGAVPHALVQVSDTVSVDDLRAFVTERLSHYKRPHSYEFVAHPLRDDAGKVRRSTLRAERLAAV